MPQMKVMDYQVCYTNHKTYKEDGRKDGSPVRIFTNVPLSSISYPQSEKRYKFCPDCQLFSSKSNPHCKICRKCPSKSGATYKHCSDCQKCIKPTYQHCKNCTRCVQKVHNCIDFQKNQECQLCLIKGHVEVRCKKFRHLLKLKKKGACRLCGLTKGHVIKDCPMRERLLGEQYFMGDVLRD